MSLALTLLPDIEMVMVKREYTQDMNKKKIMSIHQKVAQKKVWLSTYLQVLMQ